MKDVNAVLLDISEVMSDAVYFVHMRDLVERWAVQALDGNRPAHDMISTIDTFHRLCLAVKNSLDSKNV
jgi:hypothetical protein